MECLDTLPWSASKEKDFILIPARRLPQPARSSPTFLSAVAIMLRIEQILSGRGRGRWTGTIPAFRVLYPEGGLAAKSRKLDVGEAGNCLSVVELAHSSSNKTRR